MSTAIDKLQAIQVWEQPTQTVVIPQVILDVLTAKPKPKPTRKPRK